jgi:hypothetical protein
MIASVRLPALIDEDHRARSTEKRQLARNPLVRANPPLIPEFNPQRRHQA